MQLSEVLSLSSDYQQADIDELVAVTQSTRLSSPSAILRYGKISPPELHDWLKKSCTATLCEEFLLNRISSLKRFDQLPVDTLQERLVVRDLDIPRLGEYAGGEHAGRIIAHADYRLIPSYGSQKEETSSQDEPTPSSSYPAGFDNALHSHITSSVNSTMKKLFSGLPMFELVSISTLSPSHLRQGTGKRLIEWAFPHADQLGLPVVLSASPMGLSLYRKCGFNEYREFDVDVDLEQWGGEGYHTLVAMVRWPNTDVRLPPSWKEWRDIHGEGSKAK